MARLIDLLPPFLRENKEYKAIFDYAAEYQLEEAEQAYNLAMDNQFVLTSDSNTIRRWEKMMGLTPDYAMTLQMRRERVFFSLNTYVPYTWRHLEGLFEQLYPEGMFRLELDIAHYKITIYTRLGVQDISPVMLEQVARIIPLNMLYTTDILYNRWQDLEPFTWAVMENYTWQQAEEDYITNVPITPYVTSISTNGSIATDGTVTPTTQVDVTLDLPVTVLQANVSIDDPDGVVELLTVVNTADGFSMGITPITMDAAVHTHSNVHISVSDLEGFNDFEFDITVVPNILYRAKWKIFTVDPLSDSDVMHKTKFFTLMFDSSLAAQAFVDFGTIYLKSPNGYLTNSVEITKVLDSSGIVVDVLFDYDIFDILLYPVQYVIPEILIDGFELTNDNNFGNTTNIYTNFRLNGLKVETYDSTSYTQSFAYVKTLPIATRNAVLLYNSYLTTFNPARMADFMSILFGTNQIVSTYNLSYGSTTRLLNVPASVPASANTQVYFETPIRLYKDTYLTMLVKPFYSGNGDISSNDRLWLFNNRNIYFEVGFVSGSKSNKYVGRLFSANNHMADFTVDFEDSSVKGKAATGVLRVIGYHASGYLSGAYRFIDTTFFNIEARVQS